MMVIRRLASTLALASAMILAAPRSGVADNPSVTIVDPDTGDEFVEGDPILVRASVTGDDIYEVNVTLYYTDGSRTWVLTPEIVLSLQPTGKWIAEFTAIRADIADDLGYWGYYFIKVVIINDEIETLAYDTQPIVIKKRPEEPEE